MKDENTLIVIAFIFIIVLIGGYIYLDKKHSSEIDDLKDEINKEDDSAKVVYVKRDLHPFYYRRPYPRRYFGGIRRPFRRPPPSS